MPCIQAIHDIAAGEEIFVLYGYDLDYCPDWYMEAWDKGDIHSYCHTDKDSLVVLIAPTIVSTTGIFTTTLIQHKVLLNEDYLYIFR